MAIHLNGTSSYGYAAGYIDPITVPLVPYTISCWARLTAISQLNTQHLVGFGKISGRTASNRECFRIAIDTSNRLIAQAGDDVGADNSTTTATVVAGSWFHAVGQFRSATYRRAWLNGTAATANTTARTPTLNSNSLLLGASILDTNPLTINQYTGGQISHVAIWNVDLSDTEIQRLAHGVPATMIRPNNLIAYFPLDDIYPRPRVYAADAGGGLAIYDRSNLDILGDNFGGQDLDNAIAFQSVEPTIHTPPLFETVPRFAQKLPRLMYVPLTNKLRSQIAFLKPYTGILPIANG